jgi:hypothetical protein
MHGCNGGLAGYAAAAMQGMCIIKRCMAEKALVLRSAQQTPTANYIMRMQLLRSPFWLHSLQSIVQSYRLLQVPATLHATTQQKEHN